MEVCPHVEVLQGRDGRDGRDGGKGEKGEMGPQGERGKQVLGGQRETKERQDQREVMDCLVFEDYLEFLVPRGQWVTRVVVGPLVCVVFKEKKEHRVHQQEGQSTLAGGGPTVPVTSKLNLSILEELEGLALIIMVEELTSSAYLMILSILYMIV